MRDRISIDIADHIADVRLVRSDKMNALDPAMFDALAEAGDVLRASKEVRAIVLSGEGRAFCAGLDLKNFESMAAGKAPPRDLIARTHGIANLPQHIALQWREMPVPVIAAVHGVAFGGGFQLMLGADLRFVHPETQLSLMEIRWGLVPDMGGMWLIRDLLRPDVAADLVFTGRIFSGDEALRLGLATRVCADPRATALEAAREIASKSPDAIRAAKRILSLDHAELRARVLMAEAVEQTALRSKPNQVEAVRAAQERRPPVFADS